MLAVPAILGLVHIRESRHSWCRIYIYIFIDKYCHNFLIKCYKIKRYAVWKLFHYCKLTMYNNLLNNIAVLLLNTVLFSMLDFFWLCLDQSVYMDVCAWILVLVIVALNSLLEIKGWKATRWNEMKASFVSQIRCLGMRKILFFLLQGLLLIFFFDVKSQSFLLKLLPSRGILFR